MKYINVILLFLLSIFYSNYSQADDLVISELQKGGKIVFIRHSLAPGNGDPDNIDLKKCDTQRNLNQEGIEQSKKLENYLEKTIFKLIKYYLVSGVDVRTLLNMLFNNTKHLKVLILFIRKNFTNIKTSRLKI